MIKKFILPILLLSSCSPKLYQSSTSTVDSVNTSYKDTTVTIAADSEETTFNIFNYCDSLNKLRAKDTAIKYIPTYITTQSPGGIKEIIKIDSSGKETLIAERDQYKIKFDSLIKITSENKTITNTVIVEKCTSKWHAFCVKFFWVVSIAIVLVVAIKVGFKL
jgi:hypothetical protein